VLRHTINLNREVGTAYLQAEWEDKINPCVTVTRDAIRIATGRNKMRDKVIEQYEVALRRPGASGRRHAEDLHLADPFAEERIQLGNGTASQERG
jgi:hypothetical protein